MLIRFLRDFQSARTREVFYPEGTEVDLVEAQALVDEGVAEIVTIEVRTGQVDPTGSPDNLVPFAEMGGDEVFEGKPLDVKLAKPKPKGRKTS